MSKGSKKLSNPYSTGGGGAHFEAHIQASFVALMLSGGYAPCLPCWPIKEVKLQGKVDGYDTDDLIVVVERPDTKERRKLLGQVKHSIRIATGDKVFSEVIEAAWNDFNNPELFSRDKDVIALITGPLSATDYHNVQWLLGQAKHTKNAEEFYRHVERANFSPAKAPEKLKVIEYHLRRANQGRETSREEVYSFLNHFHLLGYDLGEEAGVVLPLLHSHISQFNHQFPQWVWSGVVTAVQTWNQNAGTITRERLPEDLRQAFRQQAVVRIPTELTVAQRASQETSWGQHSYATDLALVNLVGAWHEKSPADIDILSTITNQAYPILAPKAREMLQYADTPLTLQNGRWEITDRARMWDTLGSRIFDDNLDTFKVAVVSSLTERDPSFELPTGERFTAVIHGKVLSHSPVIRKGLAEGLALLGTRPGALIHCSQGKAEATAVLAVREILADADWVLWGTLNALLPTLAEAAPDEFLRAVESALDKEHCPFDELFAQEGVGITGGNYLTGLLWALETLAWDEKYLVRVCVLLGELASRDPGGNWANRPSASLATILLPWYPQTTARVEKRKVAAQTLRKECPTVAWRLILAMLPHSHQVTMGSHKPTWRNTIPEGSGDAVPKPDEYWDEISFYCDLAVEMASRDMGKMGELIDNLNVLTRPAFDKVLEVLSADDVAKLPDEERRPLWDSLTKFTLHHRRFSDANWAMEAKHLASIDVVASKLAPVNPVNLYRHLFSGRDADLYEENGNWEEQRQQLDQRREAAMRQILQVGGIDSVLDFVESVESPAQVGYTLGCISSDGIDKVLLPHYLGSEDRKLSVFTSRYVWGRHYTNGWSWADGLDKSKWNTQLIAQLLGCLPFITETWTRASEWLGDGEAVYWQTADVNPYLEMDLRFAIDKLIENGRPHAAINCLFRQLQDKEPLNIDQTVRALLTAVTSPEPAQSVNGYPVVELIKALQQAPDVARDDLIRVEWAYLPILEHYPGAAPKLMEHRLARDPDFFAEIIRLVYRPRGSHAVVTESSAETKRIAENAWHLLRRWRTPPGVHADGRLDGTEFSSWLLRVKDLCRESGHLEVALITVGEVLIHCPPDAGGLWINHTVADALNARDAEDMRRGFSAGIYNSRGAHWVDPTGTPERELAKQYRKKAEDTENAGYQRLAATLKTVADDYDREAERIIAEHRRESHDGE